MKRSVFRLQMIALGAAIGAAIASVSAFAANGNVYVSRFWHNHQPTYWPDWNSNGSQNQRVQYAWDSIVLKPGQNYGGISPTQHPENDLGDIFDLDDRRNAYQGRPNESLNTFSGGGFALSYSGSLIDNVRQLGSGGNLGYGSGWNGGNTSARQSGRLDLVGFTYHHSLAPLLPKEVFRKELQIFKQAWWKAWGGNSDLSDHSKGYFPTEMAFSESLIDVLVDEGYEWSIVASHHLSRTSPSYFDQFNLDAGNYGIASTPPNRADLLAPTFATGWWYGEPNPGNAAWNVAPYAYQLHKAQYVNPNSGAAKQLYLVPSDDVLSYRFGYANEGIGKIQDNIAPYANDSSKPVIVMPASDGDNAWGGGYSSWMEATPQYFNSAAGAGYNKSTPQAFVNAAKANADLVHIEDGAWIFPEMDYGAPNFLKWIEPPLYNTAISATNRYPGTNADLESPGFALKFFSYAPLMAGANWVITAEQILKDEGGSVASWKVQAPYDWDGTWTNPNDVELAWHIYLAGLDSGFNYYGGLGNDDEVKPALATKNAIDKLQSFMSTRMNKDETGPTVLRPQRFPYNPGTYTFGWYNVIPNGDQRYLKKMPSEFYVWTHAYDLAGIPDGEVVLKVRVDNDGVNSLATTDNETYAGGSGVGSWISIPMTKRVLPKTRSALNTAASNGQIDYFVFDPAFWANPVIADYYFAKISEANVAGFRGKLLDYYIEAKDARGNVSKSDIQHVYVADDGEDPSVYPFATFAPALPSDCEPITVNFNAATSALASAVTVNISYHFSTNSDDWASVAMSRTGTNTFSYTFTTNEIPDNAPQLEVKFGDGVNEANNNGSNWKTSIRDCDAPVPLATVTISPTNATACEPITIIYNPDGRILEGASTVKIHIGRNGWKDVILPNPGMTKDGAYWTYQYTPLAGSTNIDVVFNDGGNTWDNNSGADWHFSITECDPLPAGLVITNPADSASFPFETASIDLSGVADEMTGHLLWSNTLTGASGAIPATTPWTVAGIAIEVGGNEISIQGSNTVASGAATNALDSASDAAYSDGWSDGSNGGTGFGAWTLLADEGNSGHFVSQQNGWGLWSHEGGYMAEALRPLSSPLATGQTFSVHMKNGWIWEQGGSVGVALRSDGDTVWQLYFNGGDTNYSLTTGATDIAWTDAGIDIAFTLTSPTTYSVDVTPVGGSKRNYTGTLTGTIDNFRAWSYQNGSDDEQNSNRDYFINNLKITSPAPGGNQDYSDYIIVIRQAAPEEPVVAGMAMVMSGDQFQFGLTSSVPSRTYAVWSSPELFPNQNWQKVEGTEMVGSGNALDLTVPVSPLSTNFYRIGFVQ